MIEKESNSMILLRGLPGSGKSTLAKVLSRNKAFPVISIDDYFTDPESGTYNFDPYKNHLAYSECQKKTEDHLKTGIETIFIDNTFTLEWEMEPYFKLAALYNYRIFVITVENRHKGINIHDVSREQLEKMAAKYKIILL
jgi:predicted kinase